MEIWLSKMKKNVNPLIMVFLQLISSDSDKSLVEIAPNKQTYTYND